MASTMSRMSRPGRPGCPAGSARAASPASPAASIARSTKTAADPVEGPVQLDEAHGRGAGGLGAAPRRARRRQSHPPRGRREAAQQGAQDACHRPPRIADRRAPGRRRWATIRRIVPDRLPDPTDLLPHRPPFLFVDEILDLAPGESARARWRVDPAAAFFAGALPGEPDPAGGDHRGGPRPDRGPGGARRARERGQARALRGHRAGALPPRRAARRGAGAGDAPHPPPRAAGRGRGDGQRGRRDGLRDRPSSSRWSTPRRRGRRRDLEPQRRGRPRAAGGAGRLRPRDAWSRTTTSPGASRRATSGSSPAPASASGATPRPTRPRATSP